MDTNISALLQLLQSLSQGGPSQDNPPQFTSTQPMPQLDPGMFAEDVRLQGFRPRETPATMR